MSWQYDVFGGDPPLPLIKIPGSRTTTDTAQHDWVFFPCPLSFRKYTDVNRESLAASLSRYSSPFPEESVFVKRFLELLEHRDAFERNHLPGHFTASAWIVDPAKQFILLTHHAKLNKWLQPGGHADGDENILRVALKEAREETGVSHFRVLKDGIFDIDIHTIPARNDFPEHLHYDIRFLFEADKRNALSVTEESHDLAWVPAGEVPALSGGNTSIIRMISKVNPSL